ncbi:hypothetical protein KTAU_30600 [Thermogemmatispora aurantia]|nr:hypothetical protein KTAU_30600 [Thermogemmatispora aurantia]
MTLKELLVRLAWSRMDLVKRADVSITAVRNMEGGKPVRLLTAAKVLSAINAELRARGESPVSLEDLEGVVISDMDR